MSRLRWNHGQNWSAEERYQDALKNFPPDLERVPQHMLASYIGIAPESLSRLKRAVRNA